MNVPSAVPASLEDADQVLCAAASEVLPLHYLDPSNSREEMDRVAADASYNPRYVYSEANLARLGRVRQELERLDLPSYGVGLFFRQARDYLLRRAELRMNLGNDPAWLEPIYPTPPDRVVALARRILSQPLPRVHPVERPFRASDQVRLVNARLKQYALRDWRVEVKQNLSATNTDPANRMVNLRADLTCSMEEMKRLVVHEVDTHVLRAANGYAQPYRIFAVGAVPSYLMTEEGLAVVNEERMGYIDHARTRIFAARVVAAQAAQAHGFSRVYQELRDHGFSHEESYVITRRVKRGLGDTSLPGGYIKDHVYLWGRVLVEEFVLGGGDLSRLYVGKIALEHVPFVEDLGLLPPKFLPYPYT